MGQNKIGTQVGPSRQPTAPQPVNPAPAPFIPPAPGTLGGLSRQVADQRQAALMRLLQSRQLPQMNLQTPQAGPSLEPMDPEVLKLLQLLASQGGGGQ